MLNSVQKAAIRHLTASHFSPPDTRMTDKEWCEVMGITPRALQKWKQKSEFASALKAAIEEMEASQDPFATCARTFALEQIVHRYKDSKQESDKRQYLKLIMEETQHVAQSGDPISYDELSDEDLLSLCLDRAVTPAGMTLEELRQAARRADTSLDSCRPEDGEGYAEAVDGVSGVGVA